jgi:hypothetical protein
LRLPINEDELIIGKPGKIPHKFTEAYMGSFEYPETEVEPCGYPIHERCWILMTQILDINLIKAHLDVFVKALCERYRFLHSRDNAYDLNDKIREEDEWDRLRSKHGDPFEYNPCKYIPSYQRRMKCSDKVYALRDPLNIIEVRNLMKKAQKVDQQQSKKSEKSEPRKSLRRSSRLANSSKPRLRSQKGMHTEKETTTLSARRTKTLHSTSSIEPHRILLPPEIILIIMDMLQGSKEVWTLLSIFPQWGPMIPQRYWRARLVKDLMLDYEEVPELDVVDWQNLYFEVDNLLKKSHGLRNRRRIMNILEGTKELFLAYVTDETIVEC